MEFFWEVLRPSWDRIGGQKGAKWMPNRVPEGTEAQMGKTSKIAGSRAKTLFLRSRGLFLETKIVAKCGLRALGSTFEPSWGSWRLPEGSWRHLEALLEALGSLLERKKEGEGIRGELRESSGELGEDQAGPGEG